MKVVVFGSRGMLGRYVSTYFSRVGHEVKTVTRDEFDASDFSQYSQLPAIIEGADAIINCIGTIKPVANVQDKAITFMVNSIFPNYLARVALERSIKFVHITTDCVYSGNKGSYDEYDRSDMLDDYGFSKSIGDYCQDYGHVLRTSIIGEELENKRSLVEWVKSQAGKEVKGYTNHYWNGVTCLQLAKVLETSFNTLTWFGLDHVYSDTVSKYELVIMISEAFNLDVKVIPTPGPEFCDRTLTSVSKSSCFSLPPLKQQIEELVGFYNEER